jgi:hypothetical protein
MKGITQEKKNEHAHKIVFGRLQRKINFGTPRITCEDNINVHSSKNSLGIDDSVKVKRSECEVDHFTR